MTEVLCVEYSGVFQLMKSNQHVPVFASGKERQMIKEIP